jgi:hypothetical protein
MFKIIQNHQAAQAFPKCQFFFFKHQDFSKSDQNFLGRNEKRNFKTFTISLGRLKFQKTARKFKIVFFGGAFLEFFSPKSF